MTGDVTHPLIVLNANATVGEATAELDAAGAEWAVVLDVAGAADVLVSVAHLARAEPSDRVDGVRASAPRAVVADMETELGSGLPDLLRAVRDAGAPGVLLVDDGRILALLPEPILASFVASDVTVRNAIGRLAGSPVTTLIFECATDGERQLVGFYNPAAPPRCASGHLMRRVRV